MLASPAMLLRLKLDPCRLFYPYPPAKPDRLFELYLAALIDGLPWFSLASRPKDLRICRPECSR